MNEIFNFKRFGTYFLYDLKQMWRKHSKAAIFIGGSIALFYVVWVMFGLVFGQGWSSPSIEFRIFILIIAFTVLELYQAHTYGYLTEKRAGSAWLMVPASRTEKFVSMLLMTLLVIPGLFLIVFFGLDGIITLIDPTYGPALIGRFSAAYQNMIEAISTVDVDALPVQFSGKALMLTGIIGFFCNYLYFLLCGILFKKNKIIIGVAIVFGFSTLFSILTGIIFPIIAMNNPNFLDMDSMRAARLATGFLNGFVIFTCLLAIGLGWGVWRRIKTLQH